MTNHKETELNILMVCLGNICRSPMAHGIFRDKIEREGLNVYVDSAGTSGYHEGAPPDGRQQHTAKEKGIDISDLRSRKFETSDYDRFDIIYAMDESNYRDILQLSRSKEDSQKVKMILNEIHPGKHLSVPDPYYGGQSGFETVYTLLDEACEVIVEKIKNGSLR